MSEIAFKRNKVLKSLVAQQVKDPALSLLWLSFDPWPRNFRVPWAWPHSHPTPQKEEILMPYSKFKDKGLEGGACECPRRAD